jgi:predicted dehydrogenase
MATENKTFPPRMDRVREVGMLTERLCRWGIIGTADIARKNWRAIRNSGNSNLAAVASRNLDRAREFIDQCQAHSPFASVPAACGSYEELLDRHDIDAVYLPIPTALRKTWVIRAAEAGKHILCEKPCGSSAADVREMLDACRRNGVQFMDAVMFMHSARLSEFRKALDDGTSVGPLKRIASHFSFLGDDDFFRRNIRANGALEPLGCLGDLGWYTIRIALWAMHYELPERVSGCLLSERSEIPGFPPVPSEFSGELFFRNGVSSSFYCSFLTEMQQWVYMSGTKGTASMEDFVLPFYGNELACQISNPAYVKKGCDFIMHSGVRRLSVPEYSNSHDPSQESNMMRTFAGLVLSGHVDETWGEIALKTQQVLDACLVSARQGRMIYL